MGNLQKEVLVLNKLWIAIRIIPAIRAFTLLFAGKASVVDGSDYTIFDWDEWLALPTEEGDDIITTSQSNVKIPKVIVLSRYDKLPKKGMKLTKRNIFLRDNFCCQYSGVKVNAKNGNVDHVIPKSKGGKTTWNNLVACSKKINSLKGDRTPAEAGLTLISPPGRPEPQVIYIDPRINMDPYWKKFISKTT